MKIAIATEGGAVAEHFGRCPEYTVVRIEDGVVVDRSTLQNPGHEPGAIPRFLGDHGMDAIIAGGMGNKAQSLFEEMGIDHVVGVTGGIETVISCCIDGTLKGGESLCNHGHEACDHGAHQ